MKNNTTVTVKAKSFSLVGKHGTIRLKWESSRPLTQKDKQALILAIENNVKALIEMFETSI